MKKRPLEIAAVLLLALLGLPASASAQTLEKRPEQAPAPSGVPAKANSDPTYQQLRNIGLSSETSVANNLVLKRDAGTFTFRSGSFYFLAPVNGKVTGAVFLGDGSFNLVPPLEMERRSLSLLSRELAFTEEFNESVLRFTDGTYDEIKKAAGVSAGSPAGNAAGSLKEINDALRTKLKANLHGRLLEDVLSPEPGGFFIAYIKGKKYNSKLVYENDPHGVEDPEEVALYTWDENKFGVWASFHYSEEYKNGKAKGTEQNALVDIDQQKLDTQIEKSGKLNGNATTTFKALANGVRVVPFALFPKLRVESVTDATGAQLSFIQENKDEDADFFVILPKVLHQGESFSITTVYSGKDAVSNEGGGNYFPIARATWYPNTSFGDYADYDLTFRIPKGLTMVATGTPVSNVNEGDQNISEWKSEVPQAVSGFQFGKFKKEQATIASGYQIEAYANEAPPDWVTSLQHVAEDDLPGQGADRALMNQSGVALGTMSTTGMTKKALAEGQYAIALYTSYFGPAPYKRVAMTQQTACGFGQAWPALVYLPMCAFFDTTTRHSINNMFHIVFDDPYYYKVVAAHEVSHQWWGHKVGFSSYRDQWMSEGFADLSSSIFMQATQPNLQDFLNYWKWNRELLTEKNREGYRAIDVAPVTMGYRAANSKTGFDIGFRLLYPKGAYILHMIRMMMWDSRTSDHDVRFKSLMTDFSNTYANRIASTEDFKAMVEKHMTREMDLDGNNRMDWYFNQYVYGTALPTYQMDSSFGTGADGGPVLNMKITQSNVDSRFRMLVPVYLELANGKVFKLGNMRMAGNTTVEEHVPLSAIGLKERPKRAMLNYMYDVLCTPDSK